ncbi:sigma-54-dependent Fis family transcriptional regulator [Desulfovibrio inopinatus]|uniref:sigma-54-dependent Fis family transcriptional regulator n=1 Tax=Desulfovibrio inopinatus TaxID=102109 RepID=UPI0004030D75|nr:sigma 54-interacting transcriptional regulator [Desulfovibrio inopinatus]
MPAPTFASRRRQNDETSSTRREGLDPNDFYSFFSTPSVSNDLFWKKMYEARERFHNGEQDHFTNVRPHILRSWKRSFAANVSYTGLTSVCLASTDLQRILEQNEFLLSTAKPILKELLDNIHPTRNCVILTDTAGVYLHTLGDDFGFGRGASSPLRGLVSSEMIEGTTSMGICLAERQPTCVLGCEHYNPCFDGCSCTAAPIFDYANNLAGTLSMTMERDSFNHHTYGLVIAAAKAITEQMRLRHLLHETQTIMELLGEAVVVLDDSGFVRMMNRYAKRLFHVKGDAVGKEFVEVAEVTSDAHFLAPAKKVKDNECSMRLADGSSLQCLYSSSPLPEGGICVTLRESQRVHKLTNRITRAKAVYSFADILGDSQCMRQALKLARKASENSMTTLILGQSGVGKELFAQAIHNASDRRDQPFIVINCGTIPRDLVQSELFGYEPGAFTGAARQGAPGKFELADGGTLFLDEIGDMPLTAQVNLLRVLQEGEVTRVGGKRSWRVDVRVVAATHCDLAKAVENGTFRKDLFYRLNVLALTIPALSERKSDIPRLANFFLAKIAGDLNKQFDGFSPEALQSLEAYSWPGNVRELENMVERTAVMADGPFIRKADLPSEIRLAASLSTQSRSSVPTIPNQDEYCPSSHTTTAEVKVDAVCDSERKNIIGALHASGGNVSAAAKDVGVSRVTLYAHIRRYGLSLEAFRTSPY